MGFLGFWLRSSLPSKRSRIGTYPTLHLTLVVPFAPGALRYADQQSKCDDLKNLPLETRIQFSHLQPDAFKFHARGTRREVRLPCGCVGKSALPSDIWLAPITARMFDEYFAGGKPDRETYGASLTSLLKDLGDQTRLGVVMCAFDYSDGTCGLSQYGNRRCDWQSSRCRCQMQKGAARKFHGVVSLVQKASKEYRDNRKDADCL